MITISRYALYRQRSYITTLSYIAQRRSQEFFLEAPRSRLQRRQQGRVWGEGVPLPSRLGGLGNVLKRSPAESGAKPRPKSQKRVSDFRLSVHLKLERTRLTATFWYLWHFGNTYLVTFTFTINIRLYVHICPCYTVKTAVKIFFTLFGPLGPRPLWLRLWYRSQQTLLYNKQTKNRCIVRSDSNTKFAPPRVDQHLNDSTSAENVNYCQWLRPIRNCSLCRQTKSRKTRRT